MTTIFDSVIVGFDRSEQAMDALTLGRLLGSLESRDITVAHVVGTQPPFVAKTHEHAQERREKVRKVLEPALSRAADGERMQPTSIDASSPARGLYELAAEQGKYGATVLVIGSTHRGPVGRVLVGSVGELLCSGAPCAVIVAPRGFAEQAPSALADVVVGFDGSPESRTALHIGHALAHAAGSGLRVVAVLHHSILHRHGSEGALEDAAALQERLDEAVSELGSDIDTTVVEGDPVDQLAEAARGAGILVLGGRGYGPMHHVLTGSVSAKLMRCAPSPVLVLPRSARAPGVAEAGTAARERSG
jgi:nucleotide-binding universal stress UspA family protein